MFYNEYGAEAAGTIKSDKVYNMVKDFKARGVQIDGVGLQVFIPVLYPAPFEPHLSQSMLNLHIPLILFIPMQMHISVDSYPNPMAVAANIQRLGDIGVEVHITEMDVRCTNPTAERLALQATIYGHMLEACLKFTSLDFLFLKLRFASFAS